VGRDLSRQSIFKIKPVGLHPQGVGRGCKGLKPQQHTHKPDPQGSLPATAATVFSNSEMSLNEGF